MYGFFNLGAPELMVLGLLGLGGLAALIFWLTRSEGRED
jgi:hypothetical protein